MVTDKFRNVDSAHPTTISFAATQLIIPFSSLVSNRAERFRGRPLVAITNPRGETLGSNRPLDGEAYNPGFILWEDWVGWAFENRIVGEEVGNWGIAR